MSGPHLAVVDDDGAILTLLQTTLKAALGATVSAFSSAEALLAAWPGLARVDLVLTDYSMPGLDGVELARRLRALDGALPVVVLSAVEVPLESSGVVSRFLSKPCPPRQLVPVLRELLGLRAPVAEPERPPGPPNRLAALKASYRAHLGTVALGLDAQLAAAVTPEGERALRDALHQLLGTAGSYGFTEVMLAAQHLREAVIAQGSLAEPGAALKGALEAAARG